MINSASHGNLIFRIKFMFEKARGNPPCFSYLSCKKDLGSEVSVTALNEKNSSRTNAVSLVVALLFYFFEEYVWFPIHALLLKWVLSSYHIR